MCKTQFANIKPTIFLPIWQFFMQYPHSDEIFHVFTSQSVLFAPKTNTFSNLKPDVSQSEATTNKYVGFTTVYRRVYSRIYLRNNFSLPVNYRWLTHVVGGQITKY